MISLVILLFSVANVFATTVPAAKGDDIFYADGRIYVVVATVVIIIIGLFAYLFSMDRRLKKIEKKSTHKN